MKIEFEMNATVTMKLTEVQARALTALAQWDHYRLVDALVSVASPREVSKDALMSFSGVCKSDLGEGIRRINHARSVIENGIPAKGASPT